LLSFLGEEFAFVARLCETTCSLDTKLSFYISKTISLSLGLSFLFMCVKFAYLVTICVHFGQT